MGGQPRQRDKIKEVGIEGIPSLGSLAKRHLPDTCLLCFQLQSLADGVIPFSKEETEAQGQD